MMPLCTHNLVRRAGMVAVILMLVVTGCMPGTFTPEATRATETPVSGPSATPKPTLTSAPTETPSPTETASPIEISSTATPVPATPVPDIEPAATSLPAARITIVYDNYAYDDSLTTDWGFAAYIEYGDHTLLFDTGGNGAILLDNMAKLGLDLYKIEALVLSHEHGDHTGGLRALLDAGITPPVYAPARFPQSLKDNVLAHAELIEVQDAVEILPGVHSTGQMGTSIIEQSLILETSEGLVIITGCAHPGIVSIVRQAKQVVDEDVALVLGGFHLMETSRAGLARIIDDFRDLGVQQVAPTHCTGDAAIAAFADAYGDDYLQAGVGRVFAIGEATASEPVSADPFDLISLDSLFGYMEDLTAIQPYSGWRNSGTEGEAEALDYVAAQLDGFDYLNNLGMDLERQHFNVFMTTELWETRLQVTVDGQTFEVPASGLRGPRDDVAQALRFDSDGVPNDDARNPVVMEGAAVLLRSVDKIDDVGGGARGKIVFLDYAAIDRVLLGQERAVGAVETVLAAQPAGLVLITQFSNAPGESHGFAVGDNSALNWTETEPSVPVLYARLEDLGQAGIEDWDDLARVETARMTWDADIFQPGSSGNLVAHIPGQDSTHAVILSAHIDSPNNPGAMDDGSGCVILLEIARVLDAARLQPPVDLYLAWFGSEEIGLYGGAHFVLTHQDLLDRTLAMLQIDDLTRPLDGIEARLDLVTWSYRQFGDGTLAWPHYLRQAALQTLSAWPDLEIGMQDFPYPYSDNSTFSGFNVPNADLIYENAEAMEATGSFHYAAHIHDPYDTVELAREVGDVLEQMTHLVLTAALATGEGRPDLRVTPPPDRRAVFIASHTESSHMAPTSLTEIGMALSWAGFDVDAIPYGQPVTAADLADADLVVVLPPHDHPSPDAAPALYDTAWEDAELDVLEAYAHGGGFLVLANSAHRLRFGQPYDPNEDWDDLNALAERFGVIYLDDVLTSSTTRKRADHPLMEGVSTLKSLRGNGVPFAMDAGTVLAEASGVATIGWVEYGEGDVLVLSDVALLGPGVGDLTNLRFWENIAAYARSR